MFVDQSSKSTQAFHKANSYHSAQWLFRRTCAPIVDPTPLVMRIAKPAINRGPARLRGISQPSPIKRRRHCRRMQRLHKEPLLARWCRKTFQVSKPNLVRPVAGLRRTTRLAPQSGHTEPLGPDATVSMTGIHGNLWELQSRLQGLHKEFLETPVGRRW
jgi:hypothetical protein